MQRHRLQMLEQDTAVPVHDALRQTGGPGREHDPQRMVERHRLGAQRVFPDGGRLPGERPFEVLMRVCEPGHHDGQRQRGQLLPQPGDRLGAGVGTAGEPVTVGGDQGGGVELPEPVQGRGRRVVLTAGRPHGADACGGEQRDHGLGNVRQVADDAVADTDAVLAQGGGQRGRLPGEFGPAQLGAFPVLTDVHDRGAVVARVPQGVLRIVQARPREPDGPGHRGVVQRGSRVGARPYVEPVPHVLPERSEIVDGPPPQGVVVGEGDAVAPFDPSGEGGEAGARDVLFGGGPLGRDLRVGHAVAPPR